MLHINWKIATKTKRLTNWYWFHVRIIGRKHSKEKNYITYNSALKMVKKGKYKLMYYFIYFLRNTISMNHIWNIFITHFIFKHISTFVHDLLFLDFTALWYVKHITINNHITIGKILISWKIILFLRKVVLSNILQDFLPSGHLL